MADFHIEKVTALSNEKEDAIVTFIDGLNIIQGYSDTGKTCIIRCIDYIFGSKTIPFSEKTGYHGVEMVIRTTQGTIALKRSISKNSNRVNVLSHDERIESGDYDVDYRKNAKHPCLNSIWMQLMGIEEEHMVIWNRNFEKRRLTWRTLLQMIYVNENDIGREDSIVLPVQVMPRTLFLSSLLFLMTGQDFSETDAKAKKEIRTARRKAVEEYVNQQLSGISERRKKLTEQMDAFAGINVEREIADIVENLQQTEAAITQAVNESKELLGKIVQAEERAAECDVLSSRYQALKSQYMADIKRLTFIVNGEAEIHQLPHNAKCPFCEGDLAHHDRKSYIDASRAELSRIVSQLEGLGETEAEVGKERLLIKDELEELQGKRADTEKLISEQLQPKADNLSRSLQNYRAYVQMQNEAELIAEFSNGWVNDLRKLPEEEDSTLEFHPKEYFDDDFKTLMDTYAQEILEECRYENLTAARFNMSDFDIEVNGGKKAINHGKGYRAFLNTVVVLMFRKYMAAKAKYAPNLLIIDTPLLGLDQGVDDAAPESMRSALFQYFMNHQQEGQLIVVENLDSIPRLDYAASGANVITFTRGRSEGRYGFLHDVV